MNVQLWGSVILRAVSLFMATRGDMKTANSLSLLADAAEAGKNVDAHMAAVAAALKSGAQIDWDDVTSRIEADSAALQAS